MNDEARFVPYLPLDVDRSTVAERAREIFEEADRRRSVRAFSADPVPRQAIEWAIRTASTAPSGAHMQPWTFVLVGDPDIKRSIREAAEAEERENYLGGRMNEEWQAALAPLGTDWQKPFLEVAPWLVVVFEQRYGVAEDGSRYHHYYVKESVGIAVGMLLSALHRLGLAALTHTPSPMRFLSDLLGRPENERPFVLIPVGYPADDCLVPDLRRKDLAEVMVEVEK
ncbi:MAG: nitroreductase family protein [Acidimicrobiia bacterium]|nr:nitroreductase family protein [Acidimicrobiia bacterium]